MYGAYDDELLIEIALKHNIAVPEELAEENEELLISDANIPIDWERFYKIQVLICLIFRWVHSW